MGDTPLQPGAPVEFPRQHAPAASYLSPTTTTGQGRVATESSPAFPPSYLHHHQHYDSSQHAFSSQLDMAQTHGHPRTGPYNMNAMANTLPQIPYRPSPYGSRGQPRYNAVTMPSPSMAAQLPVSHFGAQAAMGLVPTQHPQYYISQQAHMGSFYTAPLSPQTQVSLSSRPDIAYYSSPVVVGQQPHPAAQYYYAQPAHFPGQTPQAQAQLMSGQYAAMNAQQTDPRLSQVQSGGQSGNPTFLAKQGSVLADGRQSVVRGPPRKPRQSGHAIWIGNLPPQTDLMSLVHHVCKEASGLESLFLISKSNCAFANFKDEQACTLAQRKLHDSKFQSVRLVSRLRKSTVEGATGVTAPTGPAASTPPASVAIHEPDITWEVEAGEEGTDSSTPPALSVDDSKTTNTSIDNNPLQKDRFFILKSLTVEDLELSVRTNIWATQSHNEETLNKAFANADNVYLVFSANKSGEYFGYARMVSPINDDPAAAIEFAPTAQSSSEVDLPKAIPTEATESAPKGRIIDDSARGTIFWEVEREEGATRTAGHEEDSVGSVVGGGGDSSSAKSGEEGSGGESRAWGKPFRLEWLSTARLPFYRTRGLRNPWNSNREVKIARDGTELQPSVGRRLISLFSRIQSPSLGVVPNHIPGGLAGAETCGAAPSIQL
ncbi:YT521-B-like domain-containing protein [Bombardia bombarda]|uniref:YT521-B-like domain-containing protein n=1 Tax=Bombardia bombarda TaxID=252184 RepID=A0AA40C7K4_9PEZI|nr:YT521-B-like domain-containing protein [Bombardia bombarda]